MQAKVETVGNEGVVAWVFGGDLVDAFGALRRDLDLVVWLACPFWRACPCRVICSAIMQRKTTGGEGCHR